MRDSQHFRISPAWTTDGNTWRQTAGWSIIECRALSAVGRCSLAARESMRINVAQESFTQRAIVLYSGRVQGVGFRYTCWRAADRFAVVGYVQNLTDGRVRLVAEGEESEIERLLEAVQLELARYIQRVDVKFDEPTDEYESFEIRR